MDFAVFFHRPEEIEVAEIMVTNPRFIGTHLGEIRFPCDVLVLSLLRSSTVMNPDTVLRLHDRLGLIGGLIYI